MQFALPKIIVYHATHVAEQNLLFFALAGVAGNALRWVVAGWSLYLQVMMIGMVLGMMFVVQEHWALFCSTLKDPMTRIIDWDEFAKYAEGKSESGFGMEDGILPLPYCNGGQAEQ